MKQHLLLKKENCETSTSSLSKVEVADDHKRAILTIPLMHVGPNKKGLFWTEQMLEEIVPLYQETNFRYDLNGQEGSSHTTNKLSSPHFDVGWTYPGSEGAWYDKGSKTLWVKGEVTHPEVIQKLERATTDGKREVNFASMGILVEEAKCSICGSEYGECSHDRLSEYGGKIAYKVPTKCSKGLHVALTNDPADGEANIAECVFQEYGLDHKSGANNYLGYDKKGDKKMDQQSTAGQDYREQTGEQNTNINNQMEGGLAPSSPQTEQPGTVPSSNEVLQGLAERIKTIEQKISEKQMQEGTPELVNASPQDQMTQDNMGGTSQHLNTEGNKMEEDPKKGQTTNEKTPVNPTETQDAGADPMSQIMGMLQQILAKMNGPEVQDMGKEAQDADKGMIKHDETKPTEHLAPGDAVTDPGDEGNKKNKEYMNKPGMVATADNTEVADQSLEVADLQKQVKELQKRLELQDSTEAPEFGGSQVESTSINVADMSATQRRDSFGEFGAYDAIFNGAESAQKFKR